jgi:predicted metal-dependent phosphoesterase TrpH
MKIDLHTHSYYSKDGFSSPYMLLKSALSKGLDGIALTDHNTCAGFKELVEAQKKLNGFIILGQEIKTQFGDIVGLFLKKEISPPFKDPFEVIKKIKEQEGIVIIPHPFDLISGFKKDLNFLKGLIDGIEVINSRSLFENRKKALIFAYENNLSLIGGSDAHYYKCVGEAYTLVEGARNLEEFKKGIIEKKTKAEGKKSSFCCFLKPTLSRLIFFRRKGRKDSLKGTDI